MEQIFITALIIAIAFVVFRTIEIKYIKKTDLIVKDVVIDTLLVYISGLIGIYGIDYIRPLSLKQEGGSPPETFTEPPKF